MSAGPELAGWLRLTQTPGVGNATGRALLGAFGLPEAIFSAGLPALCAVVPRRVAQALLAPLDALTTALIARTLAWAEAPQNHVFTLADADYPRALLEIADPPLVLYAKGRLDLLSAPCLAIVGSRNASAQGASDACQFAASLATSGWSIVSGLALGIDAAAHRGALDAAAAGSTASTIAVIGTGADLVYPARNRALAHEIAAAGCILSEYALGTPATAANFPRRNRLISGLARGVLVIEAAARSGSLITARMAAEQGREVFAIPGSIHSPLARGCHQLIRQGAKLVESAADVLEELPALQGNLHGATVVDATTTRIAATDDLLLQAMGTAPLSHDAMVLCSGLDSATLAGRLLELEMLGQVAVLPGGLYQRLY